MTKRSLSLIALGLAAALVLASCAPKPAAIAPQAKRPLILGMHAITETDADARALIGEVPALARRGVNLLVNEVDYWYDYASHPELKMDNPVKKATVKALLAACRAHGIRLVPEFQTLGHQSWAEKTFPLLVKYPHLDETPGKYPGNKGTDPWGTEFYCRSWCPLHPEVPPIVNDLYDELLDVFEADALHVGMDEVFIIADADCPRCAGKSTAELFARAVNDAHDHIVRQRGKEMMMWADRLLDGQATGYGLWEASMNGTDKAIDMVPKDIVMCDWHYEPKYPLQPTPKSVFPSPKIFADKGFRVLPTSFRDADALGRLIDQSLALGSDKVLGHLCTAWRPLRKGDSARLRQLKAASKKIRKARG
ncbi:MAG TPA: family 20 glycosylhydrolase [Candidatus Aminicenantes bacterium]|nr:family 20 glycosylhydrolase [Candidatus Aminicenantes bacterium]